MQSMSDQFYTQDNVFDQAQGLRMALAFTAYDTASEPIQDDSYGRVVFNSYQWGDQELDGKFKPARTTEI